MFNLFSKNKKNKSNENNFYAVAEGKLLALSEVSDPVFSQKMMGEGFAIRPTNGRVFSPISGKVTSIFPTQHALGLETPLGLEILVHMGLDTVELEGVPFEILVSEGEEIQPETQLALMDLTHLEKESKCADIIVAVTNSNQKLESLILEKLVMVQANEKIGNLKLK